MTKTTTPWGLSDTLLVVFIVLKLTGNIDWIWFWVLSPLWIEILISFVSGLVEDK
jgi:hypothetical protein